MPSKKTLAESRKAKREGKSPSTQAGPFVGEEIEHVRKGKHGARSTSQAIAIGLSKARRAGVKLPPEPPPKKRRSEKVLKHEGKSVVSKAALAKHGRSVARERTAAERSASAKKAARTRAR